MCVYCTKSNERLNKDDQERFVCLKETRMNEMANVSNILMFTTTHPVLSTHVFLVKPLS